MRHKTKEYKISKKELDGLVMPSGSNMCLIHVPHRNEDTRTEAGVYVVGDQDFKPAMHAERWGYVYKVCPDLVFDFRNPISLDWETDVEIKEGDMVWFDFNNAIHAYTFLCEGDWYKLMSYEFLRVVKRGEEIIPLNGYVLFSEFKPEKESDLLLDVEQDKRFGIVEYVGKLNRDYVFDEYSDDIELSVGDHVLFEDGTSKFPLESGLHNKFSDDDFVLQQRKRVIGVVDEKHEKFLRVHDKVVGVRLVEDVKKVGEIELLRPQKNYRVGIVEDSNHKNIPNGTTVVLPRGKGTKFGELEYFTEDRIMYYE